ncbi:hypothetical protein CRENBAI_024917 [Crenichthys baileyi]|uniref:Uncharacterized protein n=1 Tax=Crenichthys baileyi TaxID=28760 RepID=A0AAV9SMU8_9TELE
MPEDPSGLVESSKDRAHGRLYQGDSQTLSGTGPRPARWGLRVDGTPREGKDKVIQYKICLLTHQSIHGSAPDYLKELLSLYTPQDTPFALLPLSVSILPDQN